MNPLQAFVYTLVVCSVSFAFGAWWCSVGQTNKAIDADAYRQLHIMKLCDRCGKEFETESSESPILCQTCLTALRNDPNDSYFDRIEQQ